MTSEPPLRRPSWMFRQSAALPYRWREGTLEVLLVTSRKGKHWILPKGIVEFDLTSGESAAKEAEEEAGVVGEISSEPLGSYRYEKWGGTCHVEVYPLRVQAELGDWQESGMRRRQWQSLPAALLQVDDEGLRALIARFAATAPVPDG